MADNPIKPLTFLDLAKAVVKTWERSGYPWPGLVESFGGSDGTGMPPVDMFRDLAVGVVEKQLKDAPVPELRRLMRSRPYRNHLDIDQHFDFMQGEESLDRKELIGLAVWRYLFFQMERQSVEPEDAPEDDEDEEGENTEPKQLALPFEPSATWNARGNHCVRTL